MGKTQREYYLREQLQALKKELGDIDDRWAVDAAYETAEVQNYDGTETGRNVYKLGLGYAKRDPETGDVLTSSTKLELRNDSGESGAADKRQYLYPGQDMVA